MESADLYNSNEQFAKSASTRSRTVSRNSSHGNKSRNLSDRMLESISLSRELAGQILGEVDSCIVARIGDSGDRSIREDNNELENLGVPADNVNNKAVEIAAHLVLHCNEKDAMQNIHATTEKDKQNRLSPRLDYMSYLIHLAVFGILGVLTRYLLEKLFGPDLLALTGDDTPLYLDLPSNMLGSFLMGWFGIVFKTDLRNVSEHLVIGITTGYMGSLTTFSGWNQKMLNLSSKGHWTFAVAGIILGMLIVNECVNIGVETAGWLRRCFLEWIDECPQSTKIKLKNLRLDTVKRQFVVMIFMLVIWVSLWALSGALARKKLDNLTNGAFLWLGCLVGPFGVWARWYLARLNGQGLGKNGSLKWLPIGTLTANFLAACLMAALTTISKAVNTKRCSIILSGVQFGFLGCLSTVSTFVAEVYAIRQSGHPGRALSYALLTILPSFAAGTLIYSIPVWTKHYN